LWVKDNPDRGQVQYGIVVCGLKTTRIVGKYRIVVYGLLLRQSRSKTVKDSGDWIVGLPNLKSEIAGSENKK
jgi:hypothetical protein